MKEQVKQALDKIRPILQSDGGDVELINVDESTGKVTVALRGACGCCPAGMMTLKNVIEKKLKEEVPAVTEVVQG